MNKIKKIIFDNQKYLFSFFIFLIIILLGILSKSFFFFRDYFYYLLALFLILILFFVYNLHKNKKLNNFFKEMVDEDILLDEEIRKNKKDYFHLNLIIKIISILFIILLSVYLVLINNPNII